MSTEYRRGIPSVAHVQAATRLGLLWHRESATADHRTQFAIRVDGDVGSDFGRYFGRSPDDLTATEGTIWPYEERYSYRPIRPDGTPVDWEVLDQEVARVGQQGQPQGFRADLWSRICIHFSASMLDRSIKDVVIADAAEGLIVQGRRWSWNTVTHGATGRVAPEAFERATRQRTDILTRWTVYQELRPLYDLVDGAQGEAAMPRDVEAEWATISTGADGNLRRRDLNVRIGRDAESLYVRSSLVWRPNTEGSYSAPLRNFAAVLDAVAEQRVAARQGQTTQRQELVQSVQAVLDAPAPATNARILPMPEPRSFADVRPDRHGWRWWRVQGPGIANTAQIECSNHLGEVERQFRFRGSGFGPWTTFILDRWLDRTVIPTDEQGNPVSWEAAAGFAAEAVRGAQESVQRAASDVTPARSVGDIIVDPTTGMVRSAHTVRIESPTPPRPGPLPRFTTDELDDVDHSKTTKLDEVTLRRGKLPTVEQIAKYREVRARRTGGAVADALKESRIDCEVAQYVLERWAGGLSDGEAEIICDEAYGAVSFTRADIAKRLSHWFAIIRPTLDTSEPADTAAQRQRAEAAERKARMAALQAQLAKERAAREAELVEEPTRFSLLEVDEAADPSKSIEAWKAQRAANERRARSTVRPVTATTPEPTPAPRRKPFEVVDAQADGLSGGAAFAVLLSRAMNQNC